MKYDFTSLMNRSGHDSIAVRSDPDSGCGSQRGLLPHPDVGGRHELPVSSGPFREAIHARVNEPHFGYFNLPDAYFDSIIRWQKERNGVEDLPREAIGYENGVLGCVCFGCYRFYIPGRIHSSAFPDIHRFYRCS